MGIDSPNHLDFVTARVAGGKAASLARPRPMGVQSDPLTSWSPQGGAGQPARAPRPRRSGQPTRSRHVVSSSAHAIATPAASRSDGACFAPTVPAGARRRARRPRRQSSTCALAAVQLVAEVSRGGLCGGTLAGVVAAEPVRVVQVGQVPPTRGREPFQSRARRSRSRASRMPRGWSIGWRAAACWRATSWSRAPRRGGLGRSRRARCSAISSRRWA